MGGKNILTEKFETCSLLSTFIPRWVKIIHVLYFVINRNENIRAGIHQQLGNIPESRNVGLAGAGEV